MDFLEMLAAAKNDRRSKVIEQVNKLSAERRADYYMRIDKAHNEAVKWNADLDERGQMMKDLVDRLVVINDSEYLRQHLTTNEDECVRKESQLRNDFYSEIDKMWNVLVKYASYLGYCTNDGINEQRKAINAEFGIVDDEDK